MGTATGIKQEGVGGLVFGDDGAPLVASCAFFFIQVNGAGSRVAAALIGWRATTAITAITKSIHSDGEALYDRRLVAVNTAPKDAMTWTPSSRAWSLVSAIVDPRADVPANFAAITDPTNQPYGAR